MSHTTSTGSTAQKIKWKLWKPVGNANRPLMWSVDWETIRDATAYHLRFLEDEMTRHHEDPQRADPEHRDAWVQRREALQWRIVNARHVHTKATRYLAKTGKGGIPKRLNDLLRLSALDEPDDYIPIVDAATLIPHGVGNFFTRFNTLDNACLQGAVNHVWRDGVKYVRKSDAMRLAAYLESRQGTRL